MTSSVRERLVRAVVARIGPAIAPTPLHRQPTVPLPREASPALLLFIEGDQVLTQANDRLDRALTLRLVALARERSVYDRLARGEEPCTSNSSNRTPTPADSTPPARSSISTRQPPNG